MSQDYLPPLHLSPALQRVDWQALPIPGSPRWHRWREARKAGMDIETWLMQEAGRSEIRGLGWALVERTVEEMLTVQVEAEVERKREMPTGVPAAAPVAGSDEAWGEGRE